MDDVTQRFATIRHEIDRLKAALQTTTNDAERLDLHARINTCIRESIELINQRLTSRVGAAEVSPPGGPAARAADDMWSA